MNKFKKNNSKIKKTENISSSTSEKHFFDFGKNA